MMMRPRSSHYFLVTTLTLTVACRDEVTTPHPAAGVLATARAPAIPTVSLSVTISSDDGLGNPNSIQNDGKGAYVDGTQDVQAILDGSGTFAFNTETRTNRNAIRWVTYNFDRPVDPSNTYRPDPSNLKNYHFSTGPSQYSPFVAIQNLGVNGNPTTECVYMGNSLANATTSWRVSLHKGYEDLSSGPTAFAVVTRTSASPAVWMISPTGSCSPLSNVAALRSGDGTVLYGYYNVPFVFILRAK